MPFVDDFDDEMHGDDNDGDPYDNEEEGGKPKSKKPSASSLSQSNREAGGSRQQFSSGYSLPDAAGGLPLFDRLPDIINCQRILMSLVLYDDGLFFRLQMTMNLDWAMEELKMKTTDCRTFCAD